MNSIINWFGFKKRNPETGISQNDSIDLNAPEYYCIPTPPDVEQEWDILRRRIRQQEFVARPVNVFPALKLTAALGMVCIAGFLILMVMKRPDSIIEFSTVNQQQKTVTLADQSVVQLNCDSRLTVLEGFNDRNRNVQLSGEACFQVTPAEHPFIISTETGSVQVIGTEFNVRERNSRIEITVNEGVVQLTVRNAGRDSSICLTAKQYVSRRAGQFPEPLQNCSFSQFPFWMNHKITVNNSSFREVCDEIERLFDVQIRITDQALAQTEISGLFDAGAIDEILNTLSILVNKEYHFEDKIIVFDTSPSHSVRDS